jgi:hypothetical protein
MRPIIAKANEIMEKHGINDLELLASKLGAEVIEIPLGRIIKEVYIKDEGVIYVLQAAVFFSLPSLLYVCHLEAAR